MVTRQIRSVDIQEREDFDDLLRGLPSYGQSTLTVDVAADVEVLSLPGEFEELFATAHASNVRIELVTDDPVRRELARIYGMRQDSDGDRETAELFELEALHRTTAPPPPHPVAPVYGPTEEFTVDRDAAGGPTAPVEERYSPFDSQASFSFVTASATAERPRVIARPQRSRGKQRQREVSRSLGSGSIIVSAAVIVAAVVVLLLSLLAPSAQITVVPETRAVSAQVTYGLAGSAPGVDVAVEPTSITETLTFETSIPTTGEIVVPDTPARGMIFVTNPHTEIVVLPVGTVFARPDAEMTYVSLEPIDIPAADPFQSAQFGTAVVEIEATEPGPAGNAGVAALSGTLESGIMFQNRFPLQGGAMQTVAVVTGEDLETLKSHARTELQSRASQALNAQIPEGWALVETPEIVDEMAATYSADTGSVAETVSISAEARVAGAVYDPAALEQAARDALLEKLSFDVPAGFGLDFESIRTSAPFSDGQSGDAVLTLSAEATAKAVLGDEFEDEFASRLVGKSESYATNALHEVPGIESFNVTYGPDWLPWNPVPRLSNRISVEIDGS